MLEISKYCSVCGTGLVEQAIVCVTCGSAVENRATEKKPKTKTTALLLAVFLGYWSWLYTFCKNAWKFWTGLGVSIVAAILLSVGAQEMSRQATLQLQCGINALDGMIDYSFCEVFRIDPTLSYIGLVLVCVVWLWAVIDIARSEPDSY